MPYEWKENGTPHAATLRLWPYRSLPKAGFVWFMAATCTLLALPLLAVLGSPVLWGLLPFLMLAVAGLWWALQHSYRAAEIEETLRLEESRVSLARIGPRGLRQTWEANPHWVRVELHPTAGPVPHYITLKGGPREVELGAFLSEDERVTLAQSLTSRLQELRRVN